MRYKDNLESDEFALAVKAILFVNICKKRLIRFKIFFFIFSMMFLSLDFLYKFHRKYYKQMLSFTKI